MTPELTRLLIMTAVAAMLAWAGITLVLMLRFGVPSRVPPPPLPPRRKP